MSDQLPAISPEVLKLAQAQQERSQRAQACAGELAELLQRYRCRLEPSVTLTPGGAQFGYTIVAE